jgi:hypothetical protein
MSVNIDSYVSSKSYITWLHRLCADHHLHQYFYTLLIHSYLFFLIREINVLLVFDIRQVSLLLRETLKDAEKLHDQNQLIVAVD